MVCGSRSHTGGDACTAARAKFVRVHTRHQPHLPSCFQNFNRFFRREDAVLAEDVAELRQLLVRHLRQHFLNDASDVFISTRTVFNGNFVRAHERRDDVDGVGFVERAHRPQLAQLGFRRQPVAALCLACRRAARDHLVEARASGFGELLFGCRTGGGDCLDDASAIGRDGGIRLSGKAPLQLGSPVAGVDEVRMRIDETRHDGAAARVDARRALCDGDAIRKSDRIADVRDAPLECGDDAACQRRDFTLRESAAGRGPRARRNKVSVFDEEIRLKHADLA